MTAHPIEPSPDDDLAAGRTVQFGSVEEMDDCLVTVVRTGLPAPELADWLRTQLDADAAEIAKHPDDHEFEAWDLAAEAETNYPCFPYLRIGKKTRAG